MPHFLPQNQKYMTRIKYTKHSNNILKSKYYITLAGKVQIVLDYSKDITLFICINDEIVFTKTNIRTLSLAKRLARLLIIKRYGVRLYDEVRNVNRSS